MTFPAGLMNGGQEALDEPAGPLPTGPKKTLFLAPFLPALLYCSTFLLLKYSNSPFLLLLG